jgi:tetratricopeptide (TPR) repeat protein
MGLVGKSMLLYLGTENKKDWWMNYLRDMTVADYAATKINSQISYSFGALNQTFKEALGVLDNIEELSAQTLESINEINTKLDFIIVQNETTNSLLTEIEKNTKVPDSQKQKVFHFQQALKFLTSSRKNISYYNEALTEFLEAEKLDKYDFVLLSKIGYIYLYSEEFLNIDLAIEYYSKCIKYGIIELNKISDLNRHIIIDSYFSLALAYSLNNKNEDALKQIESAINLNADAKFYYLKAKLLFSNNEIDNGILSLEKAIDIKPEFLLATALDKDLSNIEAVQSLSKRLNESTNNILIDFLTFESSNFEVNAVKSRIKNLSKLDFPQRKNLSSKARLLKLKTPLIATLELKIESINGLKKYKPILQSLKHFIGLLNKFDSFHSVEKFVSLIENNNTINEIKTSNFDEQNFNEQDFDESFSEENVDFTQADPYFVQASRIIVQYQQGSTSLIQRRLKLGYNRAGRIIDQLEAAGIVGPNEGSKSREVLIATEKELEDFLIEKSLI